MTSALALVIVVFWVQALSASMTNPTTESMQMAQTVSSILGPILGAVLGYYFGVASGEKVAQQAELRTEAVLQEKAESDQKMTQMKVESEQTNQAMTQLKTQREKELEAMEQRYAQLEAKLNEALERERASSG